MAAAGGVTAAAGRRWHTEPPTSRRAKPPAQAAPFEPAPAGPAAETGACRAAPPFKPDPERREAPGAALEEQPESEDEWLPGHSSNGPSGAASLLWPWGHGTHNNTSWAPGVISGQMLDVSRFWETPPETHQTHGTEGGRCTSVNFGVGSKCDSPRDTAMSAGGRGWCVRL